MDGPTGLLFLSGARIASGAAIFIVGLTGPESELVGADALHVSARGTLLLHSLEMVEPRLVVVMVLLELVNHVRRTPVGFNQNQGLTGQFFW